MEEFFITHKQRIGWKISVLVFGFFLLTSGMTGIWLLETNQLKLDENATPAPIAAGNSKLELMYSTYFGGSSVDHGYAIAVDEKKAIYVTGYTRSIDFPTQNAMDETFNDLDENTDAYVFKVNPDGTLNYSTYLGGNTEEYGNDIVCDNAGAAYVTGYTRSNNFPNQNAMYTTLKGDRDAFITKINPDGSLNFSTFLGGSQSEEGEGIWVDNAGAIYVVGFTTSTDFPTQNAMNDSYNGNSDIFVTKINPNMSLNFSTYLGGSNYDRAFGMAVDSKGAIYITGYTSSDDFPIQNAVYDTYNDYFDVFVTKLNPDGSLNYSTYLGGDNFDLANDIAVDMNGAVFITGYTLSSGFPTQNAIQDSINSERDAFVTKLNPDGSLNFSTYLGGNHYDYGYGVAVNMAGAAYVSGYTYSSDFPTLNAMNETGNGEFDIFLTLFNPDGSLNFSTYFGGNADECGREITVDTFGAVYLTGFTRSDNFPILNPMNDTSNGDSDIIMAKFKMNSPPSVSNVKITPTSAYTMHDLELSYDFIDPDWDSEGNTEIIWYRNGIEQPDYENETIIYAADTEEGDIWNCTIRPFDGTEFGELVWSPNRVILVNDIPTFSRIPNNLTYVFGTTGHLLYWTVSDVAYGSRSYTVTNNNEPYNPNKLTVLGPDIMVNVEFLDIGFYEFNLTYSDGLGGEISSIVSVTVIDRLPPTLWQRFLQLLPIIGLVAALIVVGAFGLLNILKKRKI